MKKQMLLMTFLLLGASIYSHAQKPTVKLGESSGNVQVLGLGNEYLEMDSRGNYDVHVDDVYFISNGAGNIKHNCCTPHRISADLVYTAEIYDPMMGYQKSIEKGTGEKLIKEGFFSSSSNIFTSQRIVFKSGESVILVKTWEGTGKLSTVSRKKLDVYVVYPDRAGQKPQSSRKISSYSGKNPAVAPYRFDTVFTSAGKEHFAIVHRNFNNDKESVTYEVFNQDIKKVLDKTVTYDFDSDESRIASCFINDKHQMLFTLFKPRVDKKTMKGDNAPTGFNYLVLSGLGFSDNKTNKVNIKIEVSDQPYKQTIEGLPVIHQLDEDNIFFAAAVSPGNTIKAKGVKELLVAVYNIPNRKLTKKYITFPEEDINKLIEPSDEKYRKGEGRTSGFAPLMYVKQVIPSDSENAAYIIFDKDDNDNLKFTPDDQYEFMVSKVSYDGKLLWNKVLARKHVTTQLINTFEYKGNLVLCFYHHERYKDQTNHIYWMDKEGNGSYVDIPLSGDVRSVMPIGQSDNKVFLLAGEGTPFKRKSYVVEVSF